MTPFEIVVLAWLGFNILFGIWIVWNDVRATRILRQRQERN